MASCSAERATAVFTLGYSEPDPVTGKRKLLQKSMSPGKCTRAEGRPGGMQWRYRIHRTKLTLGERLTTSLEESVGPIRRMNTIEAYQNAVTKHIVPALGGVPLQMLRPGHLTKMLR